MTMADGRWSFHIKNYVETFAKNSMSQIIMRRWVTSVAALAPALVVRAESSSPFLSTAAFFSSLRGGGNTTAYETLSAPAPESPFHLAFPVHDLQLAKEFYGGILGCQEGRSSEKWQDYSLHGHQIVAHWVGNDYRCPDFYNPVDGDEVPVPHYGLALTVEQFHALAERVRNAGIEFIIEPHLRFKGMPGEQVRACWCSVLINCY
jgi:extradiol dioxygenase family protein